MKSFEGIPVSAPHGGDVELLTFIVKRVKEQRAPPSVRELCAEFGWRSTNAAAWRLHRLRHHGWIDREAPRNARVITITDAGWAALEGRTAGAA